MITTRKLPGSKGCFSVGYRWMGLVDVNLVLKKILEIVFLSS